MLQGLGRFIGNARFSGDVVTFPDTRFQSIQALRAYAANLVVVAHSVSLSTSLYQSLGPSAKWLAFLGYSGVHCFFVISGFVMARTIGRQSGTSFAFARITRIYPIYWAYLAATIAWVFWRLGTLPPWGTAIPSVFLYPAAPAQVMPVAWSLVYEMYYYAVLATVLAVRAPLIPAMLAWVFFVVSINLSAPDSVALQVMSSPLTLEFIGGCFIGFFASSRLAKLALSGGIFTLLAGSAIYLTLPTGAPWTDTVLLGLPYVAIVYGLAAQESRGKTFVSDFLTKLGDASYSIYLCHVLVISILSPIIWHAFPKNGPIGIFCCIVCIVASNMIGLASFRWLERPLLRGIKVGWFSRPMRQRSLSDLTP